MLNKQMKSVWSQYEKLEEGRGCDLFGRQMDISELLLAESTLRMPMPGGESTGVRRKAHRRDKEIGRDGARGGGHCYRQVEIPPLSPRLVPHSSL